MARVYVVSQRSTLRGVFTQKKKLWEVMFEESEMELMIAVNPTRYSDLNYSKLCKYISERGILQIYDKADKEEEEDLMGDLDNLKPEFMIWELETNKYYEPNIDIPDDDEEEEYDKVDPAFRGDGKKEREKFTF